MIIHYVGYLGEFDYDDTEFVITPTEDIKDTIRYIGNSIDPKIPEGIKRCNRMFSGCTSLVNAPKLKAIRNCNHMFSGCVSLRIAPEIPPNSNDCRGMFDGCVNIENAPKIPKYACYADIFRGTKFYGTCVRK